jgi:hypothetical protein
VFERLDGVLGPDALLTSNTSSIPIAELAASTVRPQQVLGIHFFSPVPVMKLVEIVVALDTSDESVARAEAFAESLGKTPHPGRGPLRLHRHRSPPDATRRPDHGSRPTSGSPRGARRRRRPPSLARMHARRR